MTKKNIVSFYNILIIIKFFLSKYNLSFMNRKVYLIIYKVLFINIIIPGKIEEWGFVLN